MTAERQGRNFEQKFPDFNIKDFQPGNHVAIFSAGRWQEETLAGPLRIERGRVVVEVASGGELETTVPPKKIVLPAPATGGGLNTVTIDGRDYGYDRDDWALDQNGDAVYNLTDVKSGRERLEINAEILRNLAEARQMKERVENLLARIEVVASIRRKELLARHTELVKKTENLMLEFGSPADWEDWDSHEVERVGKLLEDTRQQLIVEVAALEREIQRITNEQSTADERSKQAEQGALHGERLQNSCDREVKKRERAETKAFEALHVPWKEKKAKWDEYNQMGKGGKKGGGGDKDAEWDAKYPGQPKPTNPGLEPVKKEIDRAEIIEEIEWKYFNALAPTDSLRVEVEARRKKEADRLELPGGDYPPGDPNGTDEQKQQFTEFMDVTIRFMKTVIKEWKEKVSEKFDFDKEKKELEEKLEEMRQRIKHYPPDKELEAQIQTVHDFLLTADKNTTTREQLLEQWKKMGEIELAVYKKEISAKSKPEVAERDIDVPQSLLMEIFARRKMQVQNLMEQMYQQSLSSEDAVAAQGAIRSALKNLFDAPPDRALLLELKNHGIRSWEAFQKLLDGKMGERLVAVLNVMAQEHLRTEIAKNTYWMREGMGWREKMNESIRRSKFWAVKGRVATQIAVSVAVVGGFTFGAAALFPAAGLAGLGVVAVGGVVGGFMRGLVNRVMFGNKGAKESMAQKMHEVDERRKQEFIDQTLHDGFSDEGGIDRFASQTNAEFSAVMAQCLREASTAEVAEVAEGEPDEVAQLDANARRIYAEAIKNAEMSGNTVEVKQKKEFALALLQMQAKTMEIVQAAQEGEKVSWGALRTLMSELAGPNSDPVLIKLMAGTMKLYSGKVENVAVALVSSAVMGTGMAVAFASGDWVARAAMGGVGGALRGYQIGEGRRLRKGEEEGRRELLLEFNQAQASLNNLSTLTDGERAELADRIVRLKSAMKGGRQFEVEKAGEKVMVEEKEQWYVLALRGDPVLRKQVENLVYEAEKAGILVERERREDMDAALARLVERRNEVLEQCKTSLGTRVKKWLGRNWERTVWIVGGATVGAVVAVAVGQGIKDFRHEIFGHVATGAVVAGHTEQGSAKGGVDASSHPEGRAGGPEPVKPEPATHETPQPEPVVQKQPAVVAPEHPAEQAHIEPEPPVVPEIPQRVGLDFHNEHNPDVIRFTNEHHLTAKEFDYLQRLTDRYPQLNNPESLDKIIHSAEFADGKACAHPEIYKGTINTPIESAADAKLSTLDGILKGGNVKDGVRFLQEQNFNAHSLKNLGITGLPKVGSPGYEAALEQKLTQLVDQYQAGDKSAGKHLFDAFRHDMNRAQAPFMVKLKSGVEILPVKGVKGMSPRVWGTDESGEVLVGQAKGYTPRVSPTMAEKLEHDVYHTEKATSNEMFHEVMRNPNKVISNLSPEVEAKLGPNARITEVIPAPSRGPNAALIKTDNGAWHAVRINEVEVPVGMAGKSGAMETVYEISGLEPVSDAVASQLGAGHGAGVVAGGLETALAHGGAGQAKATALDFSHPKFDPNSPEVKAAMSAPVEHVAGLTSPSQGGGGGGAPRLAEAPATAAAARPALNAEQQRMADYLQKTGSEAHGRTEVTDKTGTHWTEEHVGAKVGKAPIAEPGQQAQPAPEAVESVPVDVEARYSHAIGEVTERWDHEINQMNVGGELTKGQLLDELHQYLGNAKLSHTGLNQSEATGDFNTMVDNMDARLKNSLPEALDFVLNQHPKGDNPIVFAPEGHESDIIKFIHNGKEYLLQDPDQVFKMVDGRLFVAPEKGGDFKPAIWGVDNDGNPVVEPREDATRMAANE